MKLSRAKRITLELRGTPIPGEAVVTLWRLGRLGKNTHLNSISPYPVKRRTRILIEIFGPAVLGTTMFIAWNWRETMNNAMGLNPYTFLLYLGVALVASIIPAAIYAFCIETWLTHEVRNRFGKIGRYKL